MSAAATTKVTVLSLRPASPSRGAKSSGYTPNRDLTSSSLPSSNQPTNRSPLHSGDTLPLRGGPLPHLVLVEMKVLETTSLCARGDNT